MAFQHPLFKFAHFPNLDNKLKVLSELAQKESWDYKKTKAPQKQPVLYNYLAYTFIRLQGEQKVFYSKDEKAACFNTGLVTEDWEEIFASFIPNPKGPEEWLLRGFEPKSERFLLQFETLPSPANYFNDPADLLYYTKYELRPNIAHIIRDNRERFPPPFSDPGSNHLLRSALEGAIAHAKMRVQRNYKTAVPQFYQGRIQLLLPLCLADNRKADLALVVYRENNVYLATTCLTIDMAYNNARLIARPDNEWLQP